MGKIILEKTFIDGLYVIKPQVNIDNRGFFCEVYNKQEMNELGLDMDFVQDNQVISKRNVLRGLHYQKKYPQGKLIRVSYGSIYDVVIDLRKDSNTYKKWFGIELTDENCKQLYIPKGFAHGYFVLSDCAVVNYKVTDYWHSGDDVEILWNDPEFNIEWPIKNGEKPIIDK